jgi:hypothetical protein
VSIEAPLAKQAAHGTFHLPDGRDAVIVERQRLIGWVENGAVESGLSRTQEAARTRSGKEGPPHEGSFGPDVSRAVEEGQARSDVRRWPDVPKTCRSRRSDLRSRSGAAGEP